MSAALRTSAALIILGLWAPAAQACVCVRDHPATMLARAQGALVGVVEARDGGTHTIRVERALKGRMPERVTVTSELTSCQVTLEVGARVGLVLNGGSVTLCDVVDPDALLLASRLPPPSGEARLVLGFAAHGFNLMAVGQRGAAGYALTEEGLPMALASCGTTLAVAAREGLPSRVWLHRLPLLTFLGGGTALPLQWVEALRCARDGAELWAAGFQGRRTVLVAARGGEVKRLLSAPRGSPVVFAGPRAYVALAGRIAVVSLADGRVRTQRHRGTFTQISVRAGRLAGRLRDGRGAVLDLATGRLTTSASGGTLVWLSRGRLLDAVGSVVRDTRLRPVRRLRGPLGEALAVEDGTAYLAAQGGVVRRLTPGARRATPFVQVPGGLTAVHAVRARAQASWHSCEKSAKTPLTT